MENFQGYFKGAKTFLALLIVLSAGGHVKLQYAMMIVGWTRVLGKILHILVLYVYIKNS
jgi:hypothetical protein